MAYVDFCAVNQQTEDCKPGNFYTAGTQGDVAAAPLFRPVDSTVHSDLIYRSPTEQVLFCVLYVERKGTGSSRDTVPPGKQTLFKRIAAEQKQIEELEREIAEIERGVSATRSSMAGFR